MSRFHVIMVVWGARYTQAFLDVVLPSQLSPGNLPALCDGGAQASYKVFTTRPDAELLKGSPVFAELQKVLPVELVFIDDVVTTRKYEAMAESHRRAIRAANAESAALLFLAPDLIFPDGTFRRVREISERGKRVILHAGLRVVKETFVPWYLERYKPDEHFRVRVSARDLVAGAFQHLHAFAKSLYWESDSFNRWPANIYWPVGDEGLVVRGFHLHPLMIHPQRTDLSPASTVDDDYLPLACPDPKDWHVVRDSDEIIVVDITDRSEFSEIPRARSSAFGLAFWMHYFAKPHHRLLATVPIRIHAAEPSKEWEKVEEKPAQLFASVDRYLAHPYLWMGWKMVLRAATYPLRKPMKSLLGQSRIERLRRMLGI